MLKLRSFSDSTPWPWGHHHAAREPDGGVRCREVTVGHWAASGPSASPTRPRPVLQPHHQAAATLFLWVSQEAVAQRLEVT